MCFGSDLLAVVGRLVKTVLTVGFSRLWSKTVGFGKVVVVVG